MLSEPFFQRTLRLDFKSATFIIPKNFAETLMAKPLEKKYTKLSWLSQLFYNTTQHETIKPDSYLPEPRIITSIITLKPRKRQNRIEKILVEIIRQSDKITKNAIRESLIRTKTCTSKNDARNYVESISLNEKILQKRVSRLSLKELQIIEKNI
jgi:16S rRNA (adenine1518-N6/adenine1519-N6)-dimethyltransferase